MWFFLRRKLPRESKPAPPPNCRSFSLVVLVGPIPLRLPHARLVGPAGLGRGLAGGQGHPPPGLASWPRAPPGLVSRPRATPRVCLKAEGTPFEGVGSTSGASWEPASSSPPPPGPKTLIDLHSMGEVYPVSLGGGRVPGGGPHVQNQPSGSKTPIPSPGAYVHGNDEGTAAAAAPSRPACCPPQCFFFNHGYLPLNAPAWRGRRFEKQ